MRPGPTSVACDAGTAAFRLAVQLGLEPTHDIRGSAASTDSSGGRPWGRA